tara:strand:+ start:220 stop:399 length:180 start_codon:yes stop_codon:yes gene_type:complete
MPECAILALPATWSTAADDTPATPSSARCTLLAQPPQVIPPTASVVVVSLMRRANPARG